MTFFIVKKTPIFAPKNVKMVVTQKNIKKKGYATVQLCFQKTRKTMWGKVSPFLCFLKKRNFSIAQKSCFFTNLTLIAAFRQKQGWDTLSSFGIHYFFVRFCSFFICFFSLGHSLIKIAESGPKYMIFDLFLGHILTHFQPFL